MLTLSHKCPRCGGWEIYKSRFRSMEVLLPLWLLRPVRCGECDQRYYRPFFYSALPRFYGSRSLIHHDLSV